jgi:NTE family protein
LFGAFWEPYANPEPASLYDTAPLSTTLNELIDFELLNQGRPRFCATAVDLESGADVVFDTERCMLNSEHLRASSALIPAFPPVEIDGRMLGDAGMSVNLPLDVVLSTPATGRLLCIALDLFPLEGRRPASLGDAACRMQDLMFATQSRRAAAAWKTIIDERVASGATATGRGARLPSITVLRLAYADQGKEVSGKAFDFSPLSARVRWDAGYRDLSHALAQLEDGRIETGQPGLSVYKPCRSTPEEDFTMRISRETLGLVGA